MKDWRRARAVMGRMAVLWESAGGGWSEKEVCLKEKGSDPWDKWNQG
jgi:hypothetical protein